MVTTEEGNDRKCPPASCRDKGRGGVDEGALCLSWLGCDLCAPRSPRWIALPPGQAQGAHPAPHPPLVPTGRVTHITPFGRQHSSGVQINLSKCIIGAPPMYRPNGLSMRSPGRYIGGVHDKSAPTISHYSGGISWNAAFS